jgi:hypothetical protein
MSTSNRDDNASVALYWDFENLHAGLIDAKHGEGTYARQDNRFKPQEPLIDVQALVELSASFGPVAINRAYGNWQFFGRYRDALLQSAVELIQLFPPGAAAKNGADIKLCLDATEDIARFPHIGTVIVIGGDSDFMPVAQKIKAAGRTLIGIGNRRNTNRHWAKSCHEFRYYDTLVAPPVLDSPSRWVRRPSRCHRQIRPPKSCAAQCGYSPRPRESPGSTKAPSGTWSSAWPRRLIRKTTGTPTSLRW